MWLSLAVIGPIWTTRWIWLRFALSYGGGLSCLNGFHGSKSVQSTGPSRSFQKNVKRKETWLSLLENGGRHFCPREKFQRTHKVWKLRCWQGSVVKLKLYQIHWYELVQADGESPDAIIWKRTHKIIYMLAYNFHEWARHLQLLRNRMSKKTKNCEFDVLCSSTMCRDAWYLRSSWPN